MAEPKLRRTWAPAEILNLGGTAGVVLAVVGAGVGLAAVLPAASSPWLGAGAYAAPAGLAFAAYWWVTQKL